MKRIITITLAVMLAVVSSIDAKRISPMSAPTKTDLKNMAQDSKDLLDPSVSPAEKKEIANVLLEDLDAAGLAEYAKLLVERKKMANDLEAARAERDTFKTGWLWNSAEWHEADKKVGQINIKLRDKNREIRAMELHQPKETSNTAKMVVAGVIATIGILAAAEYYFYPEGYMRKIFGSKTISNANQANQELYNSIAENAQEYPIITNEITETPTPIVQPTRTAPMSELQRKQEEYARNKAAAQQKLEEAKARRRANAEKAAKLGIGQQAR